MQFKDKYNILENICRRDKVIIELGCGPVKRIKEAISIDVVDLPQVDIVADLNEGLPFLSNESVDEIYSFHFLEHVNNFGGFMNELYRVLKPGGKKIGVVPHFANPFFYSDYTHKNYFGLYSFCYFSKEKYFQREVPRFYNNINFKITKMKLIFYSHCKFRKMVKKIFQYIFNLNPYMQEFYEENLCYFIPTYEIEFELEKV